MPVANRGPQRRHCYKCHYPKKGDTVFLANGGGTATLVGNPNEVGDIRVEIRDDPLATAALKPRAVQLKVNEYYTWKPPQPGHRVRLFNITDPRQVDQNDLTGVVLSKPAADGCVGVALDPPANAAPGTKEEYINVGLWNCYPGEDPETYYSYLLPETAPPGRRQSRFEEIAEMARQANQEPDQTRLWGAAMMALRLFEFKSAPLQMIMEMQLYFPQFLERKKCRHTLDKVKSSGSLIELSLECAKFAVNTDLSHSHSGGRPCICEAKQRWSRLRGMMSLLPSKRLSIMMKNKAASLHKRDAKKDGSLAVKHRA